MSKLNRAAVETINGISKDLPTLPTNFFDTISNSLTQINHDVYLSEFAANIRRKF